MRIVCPVQYELCRKKIGTRVVIYVLQEQFHAFLLSHPVLRRFKVEESSMSPTDRASPGLTAAHMSLLAKLMACLFHEKLNI